MDLFLFSDEAGCFTFSRANNASRYFIICTVSTTSLDLALSLTTLRHDLLREGVPIGDCFHATTDAQVTRDRVYEVLAASEFKFQATICEKSKAQPQVRESKARFYKYPWFYHFKHGLAPHIKQDDRLIVTAASIGTKKERDTYTKALRDVVQQSAPDINWAVDFRPALADVCLQAADYCAWAVRRKWERNDERPITTIRDKLTYEYELWRRGKTHYY